jgi:hypothetical protein
MIFNTAMTPTKKIAITPSKIGTSGAIRSSATETDAKRPAERNGAVGVAVGTSTSIAPVALHHVPAIAKERHFRRDAERGFVPVAATAELKCLTHNHFCKHCNRTFTCHSNPCLIPGDGIKIGKDKPKFPNYDISKIHQCQQGKVNRKRMAVMLGDTAKCLYGCDKPCNHNFPIDEEIAVSVNTSRYSIDGITNCKEALSVRNAWHKAKQQRISDSFNDMPWLASIAKDFRQG